MAYLNARSRRGRGTAASGLLIVVTLMAGCGGAGTAPAQTGAAASSAAATAGGSEDAVPSGLPSIDQEREAALLEEGLSEGEAEFLALTTLESEALGDNEYLVVATFPSGDQAELTITLEPDQTGDPADLELTHEVVADDFEFRLEYLVPWDAIPTDLHDEIRNGGTALVERDAILALFTPARVEVAADSAGVGVIVQGLVKSLYSQAASETARIIEERLGNRIDASGTLKMLKALEGVGNALGTSAEYLEVVRQLDELEDCARNPTNPITKRAYRDDPGYRQRILDQVAETRAEVKANAAVLYLSHLIKTGSSLIRNVPALGFIVGPGTAWSKAALNEVTAKLIDDLAKNITKCGQDYRIDSTFSGTDPANFISYEMHYTGTKCGGHEGEWVIEYAGPYSGGGDTVPVEGTLTVVIPEGQTTGTAQGTWGYVDVDESDTEQHDGQFSGTATFNGDPGDPATLQVEITSGFAFMEVGPGQPGPNISTFPLEAGDFCE